MPVKSTSHGARVLCFNLYQTITDKITGICWPYSGQSKHFQRLKRPGLDYFIINLNYALQLAVTASKINLLGALE